ncbi:hypothetical protein A3860_18170 [Niastella vici]|uniref:Uncharacterized protein n=1 Tax=Niastella vici TaxID=1703345 RepID=A0A1V9G2F5_9BACT|nr:hypothetical protein [Niastella vici]OQP64688.1 hypothetical protein A3860_18170 [Niastella vici]
MEKKNQYTIPLEELLARLKASGYELSIQQTLDIQAALLTTPVSRMEPARLKYLITPVIAKNDEEQRHIHRIIDGYVAEKTKIPPPPVPPVTRWRQKHKQLIFSLKIAGFLAVVIAGILFYISNNHQPTAPVSSKPVAQVKKDTTPVASAPKPVPQPENKLANPVTTPNSSKQVNIVAQPSGRYIAPVPIDFNLQMAVTFGTLLGVIMAWIIFYERRKKMEMKEKQRADDAIFIKRTEAKKRPNASGFEMAGDLAQPTIQFAERDYLVHQPRALQKIKSHLKKPAVIPNPAFDVKRSITQSARNAGFSTLVYSREWKDRKYLILMEDRYSDAHINYLMNYLVNIISAAVTTVIRFSFTGDVHMVQDEYGNWVSLANLAYQYKGYHLIIVGKGYSFFEEQQDQLLKKELTDIFQNWTSRSIITPTPLPDWSYQEEQLQSKFLLVPADIEAVVLLAKAIADDASISNHQLARSLSNSYSIADFNLYNIQDLKQYLNGDERLFQMACSLAVYPRLQWALTLALFDAQLKKNSNEEPTAALSYELLLKLARIPWLYANQLDDTIRLQLLTELTVETETTARETILELLDEARLNIVHDSPAYSELNTQYNINAFFLFSFDQYKYRQYSGAKEVISEYWKGLTEWALKEHVDKGGSVLLPRYKSGQSSVQEFLIQEKQFEKWNINFLKVAMLTLPAILLYILFGILKPAFVYPPQLYKNVSFVTVIKKSANCKPNLQYVINSTNGRSDTILLNQLSLIDSIPITNVQYDEIINLELWTKDNLMHPLSFAATDSFFEVQMACK